MIYEDENPKPDKLGHLQHLRFLETLSGFQGHGNLFSEIENIYNAGRNVSG